MEYHQRLKGHSNWTVIRIEHDLGNPLLCHVEGCVCRVGKGGQHCQEATPGESHPVDLCRQWVGERHRGDRKSALARDGSESLSRRRTLQ